MADSDEGTNGDESSVFTDTEKFDSKKELLDRIDRADLSAVEKLQLTELADLTVLIGGQVYPIGRKILTVVFALVKAFPMVSVGVAAVMVMGFLVSLIPFLGPTLAAILVPIARVLGVAWGAWKDIEDPLFRQRLEEFGKALQDLFSDEDPDHEPNGPMAKLQEPITLPESDEDYVIRDLDKFKGKLEIGEDAFPTLVTARTLDTAWKTIATGAVGTLVAISGPVASVTGGGGLLVGLGLATAVTPVGIVVAAAVISGAFGYGADRVYRRYRNACVKTVPKFINGAIDDLGDRLFLMVVGLGLKVAQCSEGVHDSERAAIKSHLVEEWGYSRAYCDQAFPAVEAKIDDELVEAMSESTLEFLEQNPNCNRSAMQRNFTLFLNEVAGARNGIDQSEREEIERISKILSGT